MSRPTKSGTRAARDGAHPSDRYPGLRTDHLLYQIEESSFAFGIDAPVYGRMLGNTYGNLGRIDDAIARFQEALRLQPDYAEARANLEKAWR